MLIIGTQDHAHFEACLQGMQKGYDILLEKPIATNPADILALAWAARELGRRVLVCDVLRYTPCYEAVKEAVDLADLVDAESNSVNHVNSGNEVPHRSSL